eukprot:scaffold9905_cov117-Isochrysis_galbana.AAC.2
MFVDYLTRAYALFLAGEDDTSALEDEVAFVFNSKNTQLRQEMESLRTSNVELDKQLQHLTGGETPLQKAESANRDLRADSAKFEAHIQQLQEHRAKLNDKLQAEEAERAAKASELASVTSEIETHKAVIAKQELTPADVARMHAERSHLEGELAKLRAHKEALSAQQWDQEVAVSKGVDRIHAKVAQANECSARLQDVSGPAGGDEALARAVQVSEDASGGAPYLDSDPAATSKPPLLRLKAKLSERLLRLQDQLFEEETAATRALEERTRQRDKLAALQAGLTRLEREEGLMREAHAREVDELNRKAEAMHEKIHAGRSVLDTTLADAEGELAALRAEHDGFVSMAHRSREKMYNQARRAGASPTPSCSGELPRFCGGAFAPFWSGASLVVAHSPGPLHLGAGRPLPALRPSTCCATSPLDTSPLPPGPVRARQPLLNPPPPPRARAQVVGVLDTLLSHKDQLQDQLAEVKGHVAMRAAQLQPLLDAEE